MISVRILEQKLLEGLVLAETVSILVDSCIKALVQIYDGDLYFKLREQDAKWSPLVHGQWKKFNGFFRESGRTTRGLHFPTTFDDIKSIFAIVALQPLSFHILDKNKMSYFFPFTHYFGHIIPSFTLVPQTPTDQPFQPMFVNFQPPQNSHLIERSDTIPSLNTNTNTSLGQSQVARPRPSKKKVAPRKDSDENFGWRNQNKDRNILSNILKAFVNHLTDNQGMKKYLEWLYLKLDVKSDVSNFYAFMEQHFPANRSYISAKSLRTFLRDPTQPQSLILILKHVLARFFRVEFSLVLLNSRKIRKRSKLDQMKKSRQLLEVLFEK